VLGLATASWIALVLGLFVAFMIVWSLYTSRSLRVLSACAQRLAMIYSWSAYRDERPPCRLQPLESQTVSLPPEDLLASPIRFV
jgi:hypothetical protein